MKCKKCGNLDLDYHTNGELVCTSCSNIDDQMNMVSEFQWKSQKTGNSCNYSSMKFQDSKEKNMNKAKKELQHLANALNINQYHVEAAQRLYNLALQKNAIHIRNIQHTVAAALYVICRREKTPHLLIDFADVLGKDLFTLGAVYKKFIKSMHLELPCVDPSLFIHKFCAKLQLQTKTKEIAKTALKFLQSMKRDWMVIGRRPTGLCASAILLACRVHGLELTSYDIAEALPVSKETVQKRIREFKTTSAIELTYSEFIQSQTKKPCDPPSFKKQQETCQLPKMKAAVLSLTNEAKNEENETLSDIEDEEIDEYILNDEEQKLKSILWSRANSEWLEKQKKHEEIGQKRKYQKKDKKNDPISILKKSKKFSPILNLETLQEFMGQVDKDSLLFNIQY